ncbi:hypothetical protein [Desmospora activa]|nr:hypothetical protein [Desmospora activa]
MRSCFYEEVEIGFLPLIAVASMSGDRLSRLLVFSLYQWLLYLLVED